jgi:hypothetical protein
MSVHEGCVGVRALFVLSTAEFVVHCTLATAYM